MPLRITFLPANTNNLPYSLISNPLKIICSSLPLLFLIVYLNPFLHGCSMPSPEPCIKSGKIYGNTDDLIYSDDWDSSYRRGLSYVMGGCWEDAKDQFQQAIHLRPKDQWRARTYGMHILDEYFPHRELGIAYLETGNLERAVEELVISLSMTDSGKAKYFLNKANRRLLEQKGIDHTPPEIHFMDIKDGYANTIYTNQSNYKLKGDVTDDFFVSTIQLNGRRVFIDLARPAVPFTMDVRLLPGQNRLVCMANDLVGNEKDATLDLILDQTGPMVIFGNRDTSRNDRDKSPGMPIHHDIYKEKSTMDAEEKMAPAHEHSNKEKPINRRDYSKGTDSPIHSGDRLPKIRIKGLIYDQGGLEGCMIGENEIVIEKGEKLKEFEIELPADTNLAFTATDLAGNITAGKLDIHAPDLSGNTTTDKLDIHHSPWREYPQPQPFKPFRIASADQDIQIPSDSSYYKPNDRPVLKDKRIELKYPSVVYEPMVYITGKVFLKREIVEIKINGEYIYNQKKDSSLLDYLQRLWHGERRLFYFTRLIEGLSEGKNSIIITAMDNNGGMLQKEIDIEYRQRGIDSQENRWRMAIIRFDIHPLKEAFLVDPAPTPISFIRDDIQTYFYQTHRFMLIERDKIDRIMQEMEIASGSMIDKTIGPKLGRLLTAEVFLHGTIAEKWDNRDRCLEIIARLIDAETTEVLGVISIFNRWNYHEEEYILSGLAEMFKSEFPILKGEVLSKEGDGLILNLKESDLLKRGMKVMIFHSPFEGNNILCEAKVKRVTRDFSQTMPLDEVSLEKVNTGDFIISK